AMSFFFFSSRRRHTRFSRDWSSDVCSSDLATSSVTSRAQNCALPPSARMRSARASPSPSSTSVTATAAPSRASIMHAAAPIPKAPPVTTATLSAVRAIWSAFRAVYSKRDRAGPAELKNRSRAASVRHHMHALAHHLGGIAPFVVVPAHDLDQIAADDIGHGQIDDCAPWILDDVGGYDRIFD